MAQGDVDGRAHRAPPTQPAASASPHDESYASTATATPGGMAAAMALAQQAAAAAAAAASEAEKGNSSSGEPAAAAAPPADLKAFLGQFDSVIQAYSRYLHEQDRGGSKTCSECGAAMGAHDKFCPNCGVPQNIPLNASRDASRIDTSRDDTRDTSFDDTRAREELAQAATAFILQHTQPQRAVAGTMAGGVAPPSPPPPPQPTHVPAHEKVLAAASPPGFDVGHLRGLMQQGATVEEAPGHLAAAYAAGGRIFRDDHYAPAAAHAVPQHYQQHQHHHRAGQRRSGTPTHHTGRRSGVGGGGGRTPKRVPPPADSVLETHSQRTATTPGSHHNSGGYQQLHYASSGRAGASTPGRRGRSGGSRPHTPSTGRLHGGHSGATSRDSSFVSTASSARLRSYSEKNRIRDQNRTDPSLMGGFFLPDDLRGSASFARAPRFTKPCGFNDENVPMYFLDDSVSVEIKRNRSRSVPNRMSSTSTRGKVGGNVTNRWGQLDVAASPGPGSYNPRWAKAR